MSRSTIIIAFTAFTTHLMTLGLYYINLLMLPFYYRPSL